VADYHALETPSNLMNGTAGRDDLRNPVVNRTKLTSNLSNTDRESEREELATYFAAIARALYSAKTLDGTLQHIVDFAVEAIDSCTGAGIALVDGQQVITPVASDANVLALDAMQNVSGEGPALAAIAEHGNFFSDDLATDRRWPALAALLAGTGPCSALSVCLVGDVTLGALNLYSADGAAFDRSDRTKALIFAVHAGVALAAAAELADAEAALAVELERLGNLQGALASRQVIGRAEGILMEREHVTADQAFDLLRQASQHLNTKLRDVAQHVVDTGQVPGSPS
jgi:hypothetical protein